MTPNNTVLLFEISNSRNVYANTSITIGLDAAPELSELKLPLVVWGRFAMCRVIVVPRWKRWGLFVDRSLMECSDATELSVGFRLKSPNKVDQHVGRTSAVGIYWKWADFEATSIKNTHNHHHTSTPISGAFGLGNVSTFDWMARLKLLLLIPKSKNASNSLNIVHILLIGSCCP